MEVIASTLEAIAPGWRPALLVYKTQTQPCIRHQREKGRRGLPATKYASRDTPGRGVYLGVASRDTKEQKKGRKGS